MTSVLAERDTAVALGERHRPGEDGATAVTAGDAEAAAVPSSTAGEVRQPAGRATVVGRPTTSSRTRMTSSAPTWTSTPADRALAWRVVFANASRTTATASSPTSGGTVAVTPSVRSRARNPRIFRGVHDLGVDPCRKPNDSARGREPSR